MSEALKALNNIRTLRAHARETDLATLEEMLEKLSAVVEDRREEESAVRKEQEERQAKLEAFRQKLLEDGIDPAELLAAVGSSQPKTKSTRAPRPAKYKYTDENGNEQTGQVRVALLKRSLLLSKQVKNWKTSHSDHNKTVNLIWRFYFRSL